jgi:hypothetical protein
MKHFILSVVLVLGAWGLQAQQTVSGKADLSVFPNPACDLISVRDNNDVVGQVAVYSLIGRKLKEFDFSKGEQYPIGDLPKGMYLVQLLDKNREIIKTQKIDKR